MQQEELTEKTIGCASTVSNALGIADLESVYKKALVHELDKVGLKAERQFPLEVKYDGVSVGEFFVDILVEQQVIIELKAAHSVDEIHMDQCLNYLRATNLEVALLLNFGTPKIQNQARRPVIVSGVSLLIRVHPCSSVANK